MFKTIDELAVLFNKISKGTATEEEQAEYKISIKTSCMREDILEMLIKDKADELKDE